MSVDKKTNKKYVSLLFLVKKNKTKQRYCCRKVNRCSKIRKEKKNKIKPKQMQQVVGDLWEGILQKEFHVWSS